MRMVKHRCKGVDEVVTKFKNMNHKNQKDRRYV